MEYSLEMKVDSLQVARRNSKFIHHGSKLVQLVADIHQKTTRSLPKGELVDKTTWAITIARLLVESCMPLFHAWVSAFFFLVYGMRRPRPHDGWADLVCTMGQPTLSA